jgi:2-keto-4-pentenoate hydratase/2-oxohepta-3-ene-1,7-dioic acid hydratase in catechol pathway
MKLLTYRWQGKESFGVVAGDGIVDIGSRLGAKYRDLKAVLAAGALDEVRRAAEGRKPDAPLAEIAYLPVIPNPDKLLMVGLNYKAHREEAGRPETEKPTIFARYADSQIGHDQPIVRPRESDKLDYEGELAVIIGKEGRRIATAQALSHVAGYACYNDGSVRDFQRHTSQWHPGKNFVATGPFGPWMVTADEIPDPQTLTLETRLNGKVMQHTTTDLMIFPVAELIAYCSSFCNLAPGDVIVSGTPGGVGYARKPPVFMKPGDTVEIEISKIGVLRNGVIDD